MGDRSVCSAPIESIAHGEGEEACKSMADQYLQILLVKKTRAYWHDLFLKSPTERKGLHVLFFILRKA